MTRKLTKKETKRWQAALVEMEDGHYDLMHAWFDGLENGPQGTELTPEILGTLKGENVVFIVGHGTLGSEATTDFLMKDGRIFVMRDSYDSPEAMTQVQDVAAGVALGIDPDIRAMEGNDAWVKYAVTLGGTVWIRRELIAKDPLPVLLRLYRDGAFEAQKRAEACGDPEAFDPQLVKRALTVDQIFILHHPHAMMCHLSDWFHNFGCPV